MADGWNTMVGWWGGGDRESVIDTGLEGLSLRWRLHSEGMQHPIHRCTSSLHLPPPRCSPRTAPPTCAGCA